MNITTQNQHIFQLSFLTHRNWNSWFYCQCYFHSQFVPQEYNTVSARCHSVACCNKDSLCQLYLPLHISYSTQSDRTNSLLCLSAPSPFLLCPNPTALPPLKQATRPLETWVRIPGWKMSGLRGEQEGYWKNKRHSFTSGITWVNFFPEWNPIFGLGSCFHFTNVHTAAHILWSAGV